MAEKHVAQESASVMQSSVCRIDFPAAIDLIESATFGDRYEAVSAAPNRLLRAADVGDVTVSGV